jgi:hypothetical protein
MCSLRYPACKAHACIILSSVTVGLYHIFPHYLIKVRFSGKKFLDVKYVLSFSLQVLPETILILRRTEQDIIINVHRYINLKYSLCRVIHKSLRDFRPLRYSSRDGHAEGDNVNRGRETPNFCRTLQVLDMCTLGDVADVNPVPIKFLRHAL